MFIMSIHAEPKTRRSGILTVGSLLTTPTAIGWIISARHFSSQGLHNVFRAAVQTYGLFSPNIMTGTRRLPSYPAVAASLTCTPITWRFYCCLKHLQRPKGSEHQHYQILFSATTPNHNELETQPQP
jgi:hypothetical protein